MTPLSSRQTATDVSTCWGGQPVHGRGDDPRHVTKEEEGEERDEDHEQEEVPGVLEEFARVPGGTVEDEPVDPAPALGEHTAEHRCRLDELPHRAVEASVELNRQRRQAVRERRQLGGHAWAPGAGPRRAAAR